MDNILIIFKKYNILLLLIIFQISEARIKDGNYTIEVFDSDDYKHGQISKNNKGDIIIEFSAENSKRIFYGLKKDGKGFFNGDYKKEIDLGNNQVRYEAKNMLITSNRSNDENNQYLLSFAANESVAELYNISGDISQNTNYGTKLTKNVLGNSIFSDQFSLLELNNTEKEYLVIYISQQNYYAQKFSFSGLSPNFDYISIKKTYPSTYQKYPEGNRMVDGIILNENLFIILCSLKNGGRSFFYINIINFNLTFQRGYELDTINIANDADGLFAKSFKLKNDYLLFIYYTEKDGFLKIKFGRNQENNLYLNLNITTSYKFNSTPILNEAIKINSQRIVYFTVKNSSVPKENMGAISQEIYIILIDLYNNYQNLKIRIYEMKLNKYKTNKEFSIEIYNDLICFTTTVYNMDTEKLTSMFLILGYFNETNNDSNITINIYDFLTDQNNNSNIVDYILTNRNIKNNQIENNFFGYELSKENIRLVQIPEEIEFFNGNNLTKLENGDILNRNYTLKQGGNNVTNQEIYFFEYQIIIHEPDYETFNSYFQNISDYNSSGKIIDEQKKYFKPQQFYGKIFSVNFIFCPKYNNYDSSLPQSSFIGQTDYEQISQINTQFVEKSNNSSLYKQIQDTIIKSYPDNGESIIIEAEKDYIFQITTLKNELSSLKGNKSHNISISIIDLGDCGILLKDHYNLTEEQNLILLKYEKLTQIASERNVQYEIYHPINKYKLNIIICENAPISIYIPVNLPEETKKKYEELERQGYDLFNPNDSFYQDICTPFKTENNTDINLNDRKIYYYKNYSNNTQCQGNCQYAEYLSKLDYLKCECNIDSDNNIETNEEEIKFENKMIYESFYDTLKNSNYKVVKCYNLIFNKKIILNNLGSIIVLIYIFIFTIFFAIFIFKGINPLKISIMKLIDEKGIFQNQNDFSYFLYPPKKSSEKHNNKNKINKKNTVVIKNNNILINSDKSQKKSKRETITNDTINIHKHSSKTIIINPKINEQKEKKLDEFEINNLEYLEAIQSDKRDLIQIYWSILKREHIAIFTFFIRNDYNLVYIKFSRFIFLVCTDMAMNVIFFTDDSMHKIYTNYGKYVFIQQIPQIIYSTAVSQALELILCFLSLTDKHFYQIKKKKNSQKNLENIFKILKCVKLKLVGFYLFTFIFFGFYWYFISAFCAVYQNTQIIFIKDSVSSFIAGLLYPFVLYLFPAIFRVIALSDRKNKRLKIIYSISDIIPIF